MARMLRKQSARKGLPTWLIVTVIVIALAAVGAMCWNMVAESMQLSNEAYEAMQENQRMLGR